MGYFYEDERELEAKVGQFIYNTVLTERLREFLVRRVRDKDNVSLRIDLGRDRTGNQVVMDVLISRITPEVARLKSTEGEPEPPQGPEESPTEAARAGKESPPQ